MTTAVHPPADVLGRLVDGAVASAVGDGPRAACVRAARPLVGEVTALRDTLHAAGLAKVLLVTTPATGAVAEVLAGDGARLLVLDSPDPVRVADALDGDLEATVLVVAVPPGADRSGPDAVVAAVRAGFEAEGFDADAQTVVVAGPGEAVTDSARVVAGGADGAFSAYALVPAGLAGADVERVVADAVAARERYVVDDPDNPALVLGALLAGHPSVVLDVRWPAALIDAVLPDAQPVPVVVDDGPAGPGLAEALTVRPGGAVELDGPVAARVLLWEHAAAVAAHLRAPEGTAAPDGPPSAVFVDGDVTVSAGPWLPEGTTTAVDALRALAAAGGTHLALHAHLDRESDASVAVLRGELARRTGATVTFDWGPARRPGAAVCLLTGVGDGRADLGAAQEAVVVADAAAQTGPVLRLHMHDRLAGLVAVVRAVQDL
ncbi:hypothetical protein [Pseudonocardia broussonetiae]|uniref:Glucose-6-phosphate isomerase n=1 Tax=Pseudonocardia broussonetiae TaxID=2736640 RepID=A0A6M6JN45_9PSEU|nr:hypothetical protein [Pseudonocardia broussonetiae]QJY48510.1 hypothetical protein HOP40_24235 [Pseudonocardia broussonetiae]